MTNNLKCPFCGKKLFYDEQDDIYRCMKFGCVMDYEGGTEQLWQALIDGKAAQDALKKARELYNSLAISHCEMADSFSTSYGRLKTFEQEAEEYMKEYDKEITSITTQEKE